MSTVGTAPATRCGAVTISPPQRLDGRAAASKAADNGFDSRLGHRSVAGLVRSLDAGSPAKDGLAVLVYGNPKANRFVTTVRACYQLYSTQVRLVTAAASRGECSEPA